MVGRVKRCVDAPRACNGIANRWPEKHGIRAAYAALFEPSIKEVVVIDPPSSHKDGPHLLNVLRVLDILKALGLLAIIGADE